MATESRTSRAIRIAVFNFKGGVGKSTTVLHLAAAFAGGRLRKKVCMVDWDPQCNLTQFFVDGKNVDIKFDAPPTPEAAAETMLSLGDGGSNIEPTIDHVPLGVDAEGHKVGGHTMDSYETATAGMLNVDNFVKPYFDEVDRTKAESLVDDATNSLVREVNKKDDFFKHRLWIVEGSTLLATREQDLAEECTKAKSKQRLQATLSERLLSGLEKRCGFDVIIVDMSPSCSALNKAMAMSCDYILPPCDVELFSMGAVRGLYETVLPSWFEWRKAVVGNQAPGSYGGTYNFSDDPPRVLPFLVNNFSVDSGCMYFHNAHFYNTLTDYLDNRLRDKDMRDRRCAYHGQFAIPFLPRFKRLTSIAQDMGKPCEEITETKYRNYYNFPKSPTKKTPKTDSANETKRRKTQQAAKDKGSLECQQEEEDLTTPKIESFLKELAFAKKLFVQFGTWLLYIDDQRRKKSP